MKNEKWEKMEVNTIVGKFEVDMRPQVCINCKQIFGYSNSIIEGIELCRTCFLNEKSKKENNLKSKIA